MPSVLVVDDSPVDRRLAMAILEKETSLTVRSASHGAEALARMANEVADIVVTDLQMPGMSGLELVRAVRGQYPLVPVVLMTAHGSEEIAVAALEQGAASYVPKSNLADGLGETVRNVLATARADRRHESLLDCLERAQMKFVLHCDAALIYPLVDFLQEQVARVNLGDETDRIRIGIALQEALVNAFYHGNLELSSAQMRAGLAPAFIGKRLKEPPYCDRKIHVLAELSSEIVRFTIRDEGLGFDAHATPTELLPGEGDGESCRGLVLMRTFMDEVWFNGAGNEVTMVKRRPAPAAHPDPMSRAAAVR